MKTHSFYHIASSIAIILTTCSKPEDRIVFLRFPEPPSVITYEPENVTTNTAYLCGRIIRIGSSPVTECGIHIYSCGKSPVPPSIPVPEFIEYRYSEDTAEGYFSVFLRDLTSNTTYHYRAFASNSAGTSYGEMEILKTLNDTVKSNPAI